jgi:hypothetical protein
MGEENHFTFSLAGFRLHLRGLFAPAENFSAKNAPVESWLKNRGSLHFGMDDFAGGDYEVWGDGPDVYDELTDPPLIVNDDWTPEVISDKPHDDPPLQDFSAVETGSLAPSLLDQVARSAYSDASEPDSGAARPFLLPGFLGSVVNEFRSIIKANPTLEAKCALRAFFVCTGPITRTERRKPEEMDKAFEAHREKIFNAMRCPAIMRHVCNVLVTGSRRSYDVEHNYLHAVAYLRNASQQMGD